MVPQTVIVNRDLSVPRQIIALQVCCKVFVTGTRWYQRALLDFGDFLRTPVHFKDVVGYLTSKGGFIRMLTDKVSCIEIIICMLVAGTLIFSNFCPKILKYLLFNNNLCQGNPTWMRQKISKPPS